MALRQTPEVLEIGWVGVFTALLASVLAARRATSSGCCLLHRLAARLHDGGDRRGLVAGFLHLLTHGIFKALLFLGAGAVIHAVGTNDIFAMGGLGRAMPQTFIVF